MTAKPVAADHPVQLGRHLRDRPYASGHHWNRAAERLLGRTAESAIGTRELARDVHEHDRPVLPISFLTAPTSA